MGLVHRFSSSGTSRISVLRNINGDAEADLEEFSLRRNLVPLGLVCGHQCAEVKIVERQPRSNQVSTVVVTILARKRAGDLPHLYHYY